MGAKSKANASERNEQKSAGRGGALKVAVITTALLVGEASAIVGLFAFVGRPTASHAETPAAAPADDAEELLLFEGRLSNDRAGTAFVYDTEVYVQVRKADAERIRKEIDRTRHETRAEVAAIWRTAEPGHFQEPRFETLTARLEAMLRERFDKGGRSSIVKAVVVSGAGLRLGR
ncbi:MAG: hypothetical protein U0574_04930 [Phycisphaerales bacterium]